MTGDGLKAIRKRLGLSVIEFGRVLGYEGEDNSVKVAVRRYERGDRPVPPWIARLAMMLDRYGVPEDF